IAIGPAGEDVTLFVQALLGEMLHDNGRDSEAANVYKERLTALEERANAGRQVEPAELPQTRGQMHFFYACDALEKHDLKLQRAELMKGVEADPLNADILIAMYRFPNDKAMHELSLAKVRAAAEDFRSKILQAPDDTKHYNQLAWLIANTEGDYHEALRCSQKSIELLTPDSLNHGGYLDTLGRCYYALGDYENAVKEQTKAVKLEPHSGLIKRQLDTFQKALEDSKKSK
ncbi:MAG TPA: tetratricopeptide repeat protein, partial [Pirellulales bacterium]|nr:tetratricopeptide repeat protein [Pirellulales bacterium]